MPRFLVCLDRSPRAAHVLERTIPLARASGAKLVLFHAVGMPHDAHFPREALAMSPDEVVELQRKTAQRELEALCASVPSELVESIVVRIGQPWQTICAAAKELGVDLIAIGSHGYTPLDHVLGTTAAKVVNHADRSVFVAR